MLEVFVVRETVFFLTGVMIGIGAIARLITGISLKKLVRAASNMSKSNHPLMRLVRAKFEHGCMVSDKVQNVGAFVEKYLYGIPGAWREAAYLEAVGEGEHLALPYLWIHRNSACLCSGGEGTGTLQIWYFGRYGSFGALSTPDACG